MKTCAWCETPRALGAFRRNVHSDDGRQSVCAGCHAKNERRHYQIDPMRPIRSRRSPYDNMKVVLDQIEKATGEGAVRELIDRARTEYSL